MWFLWLSINHLPWSSDGFKRRNRRRYQETLGAHPPLAGLSHAVANAGIMREISITSPQLQGPFLMAGRSAFCPACSAFFHFLPGSLPDLLKQAFISSPRCLSTSPKESAAPGSHHLTWTAFECCSKLCCRMTHTQWENAEAKKGKMRHHCKKFQSLGTI